jgi:hypothetical protein
MRRHLQLAALLTVMACDAVPPANEFDLVQIGAAWSGGRTDPKCWLEGLPATLADSVMATERCEWPTVTRGTESGTVTGSRDPVFGLKGLTWNRVLRDTAALHALRDSLARAFVAQGLTQYECDSVDRRWQHDTFGVQLNVGLPRPNGQPQVVVVATVWPWALPPISCPVAPQIPSPLPALPRRGRAT